MIVLKPLYKEVSKDGIKQMIDRIYSSSFNLSLKNVFEISHREYLERKFDLDYSSYKVLKNKLLKKYCEYERYGNS